MARIVALVFNWWSLWVRLAVPGRHTDAVKNRPALVFGLRIRELPKGPRTGINPE